MRPGGLVTEFVLLFSLPECFGYFGSGESFDFSSHLYAWDTVYVVLNRCMGF